MSFSRQLFRNIKLVSREEYLKNVAIKQQISVIETTLDDEMRATADGVIEGSGRYLMIFDGFPKTYHPKGAHLRVSLHGQTYAFTLNYNKKWLRIIIQTDRLVTSLAIENGDEVLLGETELITSTGQID